MKGDDGMGSEEMGWGGKGRRSLEKRIEGKEGSGAAGGKDLTHLRRCPDHSELLPGVSDLSSRPGEWHQMATTGLGSGPGED